MPGMYEISVKHAKAFLWSLKGKTDISLALFKCSANNGTCRKLIILSSKDFVQMLVSLTWPDGPWPEGDGRLSHASVICGAFSTFQ